VPAFRDLRDFPTSEPEARGAKMYPPRDVTYQMHHVCNAMMYLRSHILSRLTRRDALAFCFCSLGETSWEVSSPGNRIFAGLNVRHNAHKSRDLLERVHFKKSTHCTRNCSSVKC